jgi:RNA polymerase sigma-70 factor (ECF subfamily)
MAGMGALILGLLFPLLAIALRFADDRELVRRLKTRDQSAMGELYDRYGRLAFSVIIRIVRNESVAEDLVQETFLRVWNRSASFDEAKGALGAWVLAVARNRAIDYIRSIEGRESRNTLELDKVERPGLCAVIDESFLQVDRARLLKTAFEKLPPNHRMVLELAYFEGMSQTEMAEHLKQPLGTVKTWVRTALRALREEIGEAVPA